MRLGGGSTDADTFAIERWRFTSECATILLPRTDESSHMLSGMFSRSSSWKVGHMRSTTWLVSLPVLLVSTALRAGQTEMIDVSPTGNASIPSAFPDSQTVSISDDGRYVAFTTDASGILPGVPIVPGGSRVYLRDCVLGTTVLVSRRSDGSVPTSGASRLGAISGDGRYVAFTSTSVLTPNAPPMQIPTVSAAYLFDRVADSIELVSIDHGGNTVAFFGAGAPGGAGGNSGGSAISADGRFVVFDSAYPLTADAGTNTTAFRVYRRDRVLGLTELVSPAPPPTNARIASGAGISSDGTKVIYTVYGIGGTAPELGIYVRDFTAGTTQRVDVDASGVPLPGFDFSYIDWTTDTNELVFTRGFFDVYLKNRTTGAVTIISKWPVGQNPPDDSRSGTISGDGRYVAYICDTGIVPWDQNGTQYDDVVLFDRVTQRATIASISSGGEQALTGNVTTVALSADGRYLAFAGNPSNLVPGIDQEKHIYRRDRIGFTNLGYGKPGASHSIPQLSGSGSTAAGGSGTIALTQARPFGPGVLFLSLDRSYYTAQFGPLQGTVFATAAPIVTLPITTDGFGQVTLPYTLPIGIAFVPEVYLQCAIADPLALGGVSVSSALLMGL